MRLLSTFLLVLVVSVACGGDGGTRLAPPENARADAVRDVASDGAALLSTSIEVNFDSNVAFVERHVPLASNFELSVETVRADQVVSERVLVRSAHLLEDNPRRVILTVDRLIPDGAELRIRRSAFDPDLEGELLVTVRSDMGGPLAVLLASSALSISSPGVIDSAGPPELLESDRDAMVQRSVLEDHLAGRGADGEVVERALEAFDAMPDDIVQSPKLKAALAALTGTFAEPAIASLLTAQNCTGAPALLLAFQEPPEVPDLLARVTYSDDGRRIVSINPSLEGERIEHLMPLLAHEPIHCDRIAGRWEEIAATAFDSFLYLQILAWFPEMANTQTPLTKDLNVDAIALINSGRAVPESVGILPSPGVTNVLPGTTATQPSFGDLVVAAYPTINYNASPLEPLAQAYVTTLSSVAGMAEGSAFDLLYLDELLARAMDPEVYQAAILALGLGPAE